MQAFCRVLRMAEKDGKLLGMVRKYFPCFSADCHYLGPDRMTRGDWPLFYGNKGYILAAYGKVAELAGRTDGLPFRYDVATGDPADPARRWQPNVARSTSDRTALIMPASQYPLDWGALKWLKRYGEGRGLFPGYKIRRAAWWDDHGEMHPFDDNGPNLRVRLPDGVARDWLLSISCTTSTGAGPPIRASSRSWSSTTRGRS